MGIVNSAAKVAAKAAARTSLASYGGNNILREFTNNPMLNPALAFDEYDKNNASSEISDQSAKQFTQAGLDMLDHML